MDAFFASVEQLTRPTLRGRPVLVGGLGGRGVVAGASYEARVFGARSAMPMHQARRLVGIHAVVLPPRGVVYGVASRRVFDTVRAVMPVLEQLSYDEAFGEPARARRRGPGRRRDGSAKTCAVASATTPASPHRSGAGSGKQIAKIASELAKPDGIRVVRRDEERPLLAGLPVRRLWGIGPVAEEKLHRLGIQTIGQFAELTDAEAADILGGTVGPALHRLARGIDDRPVAERAEAKQISAESTFADRPDDAGAAAAGGGPDRRARPSAAAQGRPRRAHGDRQAEAIRHEHADPLVDAAVRHRRRRHVDRGCAPASPRPC